MANTYTTYKDSGIPWIGEIPKEWKVRAIKYMFRTSKGLNITKADLVEQGYPVISYGQIHSKNNTGTSVKEEMIRFVPEAFIKTNPDCLVSNGSFIFADTSEDIEGCGNAAYINTINPLFAGYHTVILNPINQASNKYFAYLFLTDCWRSQIRSQVSGIKVFSISQKIINTTSLIIPSSVEQESIANFLDEKCSEIDALISLQEKMIDELKAYKQSVITEAVTKGLDRNVKMKDSGVDWIKECPSHWQIRMIKSMAELKSGSNLTTYDISEANKYPVYGGNGLRGYYFEYSNDGDYALIGRQGALCGNINYAHGRFWATDHCVVCYPKTEYNLYWFGESLRAMNLNQYSLSSAQPGLSVDRIKKIYMLVPPICEQEKIASYLDSKCSQIDSLISIKEKKIEELKDYKKSLIYEYVTGKKRV